MPLQQLRDMVDQGKVKGEDLVWCEGMADWRRADQCDAVFPAPRRGYGRPAHGPEDDDDRPFRRRYPPPRQSSGALTVLLIAGGVIGLCLLGCAGLVFLGYVSSQSAATTYAPPMPPPPMANVPMPAPPPDDGVIFDPGVGVPQNGLGQAIPYGASELYYTNNVLLTDAQNLGNYLSNKGHFPNDHGVTVQLDKDAAGVYRARFCLKDGAAFVPDVFDYYRDLRAELGDNVFPGSDVEIDLCNGEMNTVRTVHAGD
jgi:hypothetical protein